MDESGARCADVGPRITILGAVGRINMSNDFDVVVVGSGPNGLAAAICLQQAGLSVLVVEGKDTVGGGLRSAALTLPGFTHDVCAAIHPLAVSSPFLSTLPLDRHGLSFHYPPLAVAHPLTDGKAVLLGEPVEPLVRQFGVDGAAYKRLVAPWVRRWPELAPDVLAPLRMPQHPRMFATFGMQALWPAAWQARRFQTPEARALWAGMAAHGMLPLTHGGTSAIAMVLLATAHRYGWPVARGGSQAMANAMVNYFQLMGGKVETGRYVSDLRQLPSARAVLLDVTPRQVLQLAGDRLSALYRWQLRRYRYGMGVFKIDWALDAPTPFKEPACRDAATVHIGASYEEIAFSEQQAWRGKIAERPFVLFAQPSLFDDTRVPPGKHTAWAYCHVPHGATVDMTHVIEQQIERVAPGFRERILARHTFNASEMEAYNPNYIGGDINGGVINLSQLYTRPALRTSPYRTSARGLYICSSSTPPGGGVHGMCGYHAAQQVLKDLF